MARLLRTLDALSLLVVCVLVFGSTRAEKDCGAELPSTQHSLGLKNQKRPDPARRFDGYLIGFRLLQQAPVLLFLLLDLGSRRNFVAGFEVQADGADS